MAASACVWSGRLTEGAKPSSLVGNLRRGGAGRLTREPPRCNSLLCPGRTLHHPLEDWMRLLHVAFVLCALVLPAGAADAPKKTPLDDYLAKPDPTYAWKLVGTIPGDGVTSYVLDLKSQTWRSTPEVDRPVWQHWVTI